MKYNVQNGWSKVQLKYPPLWLCSRKIPELFHGGSQMLTYNSSCSCKTKKRQKPAQPDFRLHVLVSFVPQIDG